MLNKVKKKSFMECERIYEKRAFLSIFLIRAVFNNNTNKKINLKDLLPQNSWFKVTDNTVSCTPAILFMNNIF